MTNDTKTNKTFNQNAQKTFTGTKSVEKRHQFNGGKLEQWMKKNIDNYQGPLNIQQFKGGQSNPTYLLKTPLCNYVLRRKPFGNLLPSAHAVDREFKIISALSSTSFPVAKPLGLCLDDNIIGTDFYIMEYKEGHIFWDGTYPEQSPEQRSQLYRSKVKTLSDLHQIDYSKVGLSDFGKKGNYFERQVNRWIKQYLASETEKINEMHLLMEWLPKTIPDQERTSIVHGDYRCDNVMFDNDLSSVTAVLDWELSTLGDPLADFSYFLISWVIPANGRSALGGLDLEKMGIPSLEEITEYYCQLTSREKLPNLDWYFAFNLFRLTCIGQGIVKRSKDGTAASARASEAADLIKPTAEAAWKFAQRAMN